MSSVVSLPNHTFTGQAKSSKRLTSIVHILSPETDNCPFWISRGDWLTIAKYFMINLHESICTAEARKNVADLGGGWTRDLLVSSRTVHPTEPSRLAQSLIFNTFWQNDFSRFSPYKCTGMKIWPCHKKVKCLSRVIIWTNLVDVEPQMLYTMYQDSAPKLSWFWSRRF